MSTALDPGSHISFIMTLYYKMRQILLQNATAILLQNASGFLLQNATVITNCDDFITKCDSYYIMRCLLQIAAVHCLNNSGLHLNSTRCGKLAINVIKKMEFLSKN